MEIIQSQSIIQKCFISSQSIEIDNFKLLICQLFYTFQNIGKMTFERKKICSKLRLITASVKNYKLAEQKQLREKKSQKS